MFLCVRWVGWMHEKLGELKMGKFLGKKQVSKTQVVQVGCVFLVYSTLCLFLLVDVL